MKVSELISLLQRQDPEHPVAVFDPVQNKWMDPQLRTIAMGGPIDTLIMTEGHPCTVETFDYEASDWKQGEVYNTFEAASLDAITFIDQNYDWDDVRILSGVNWYQWEGIEKGWVLQ